MNGASPTDSSVRPSGDTDALQGVSHRKRDIYGLTVIYWRANLDVSRHLNP